MFYIKQRIIDIGKGDCVKCCVASLLELTYNEVPNFSEDVDWIFAMQRFLRSYNLMPLYLQRKEPIYPKVNYIATGKSPRGEYHHAVIYKGNDMIFDPHPSNLGIETFEHIILFQPIELGLFREKDCGDDW